MQVSRRFLPSFTSYVISSILILIIISPPRAAFFVNMFHKIVPEIFESALQRLHGSGSMGTKSVSGCHIFCMEGKSVHIFGLSSSFFECLKYLICPRESFPTGSAPTAAFSRKEFYQVFNETNRTGFVVKNHHGASSQAASCISNAIEIELYIHMIRCHKICRTSAGNNASESITFLHAACMIHKNFAKGGSHW